MNKVFANIDYIVGVKVYYEELTEYEFHPETPAVVKTYFWGFYRKVLQGRKPARWLKPGHRDNYCNWLTDREVREWNKTYRVQELPKMLFKNAHIEIRYLNKDSSLVSFKSNQELDDYLDNLKNKIGSKLILIKDK